MNQMRQIQGTTGLQLGLSVLSGLMVGLAYPPYELDWLIWVALVPLFWAVSQAQSKRLAFVYGASAGLIAILITTWPLMSAGNWTGWELQTPGQMALMQERQGWFLYILWFVFMGLWSGSLYWGLFAVLLNRYGSTHPLRLMIFGTSLWVLGVEWLRTQLAWGFHWTLLGNTLADFVWVRQLAALGGVWPLSALVVAVNLGLYLLLARWRLPGYWRTPAAVAVLLVLISAGGWFRIASLSSIKADQTVAAIQYSKSQYKFKDFSDFGISNNYLMLTQQVLNKLGKNLVLLVLPESVTLGALSVDGTRNVQTASKPAFTVKRWTKELNKLLNGLDTMLIFGTDTIEKTRQYNSLVAWDHKGLVGYYNKQVLVPFAEYRPKLLGDLAVLGNTLYQAGTGSQLIRRGDLVIGGFICQEILFPHTTRASVRDGANLLVSGGNDGVFKNPAVAEIHANIAQLRAVETGRYLVRAMKTGISAVINPTGKEIIASAPYRQSVITGKIALLTSLTPYVKFGNWMLWLAVLGLIGTLILRRRK